MRTIRVQTILNAPADRVFAEALKTSALAYVAKGFLSFEPIDPPQFPQTWAPQDYRVLMKLAGHVPLGEQILGIDIPPAADGRFFIRDNGRSDTISRWDHLITIEPTGDGRTAYEDRLHLEAGWREPGVALFARQFYKHRQRRWAKLVDAGFQYND